jgi:hypothetical protein
MWQVDAGLTTMKKPDFGGYQIKTGREYVPYIGILSMPMDEKKEQGDGE